MTWQEPQPSGPGVAAGAHRAAVPGVSRAADSSDDRSIGELFGAVSRDLSTLIRQEMELAKAEVRQSATRAGAGVGMLGGAGVAGHMVLLFLSIALWWAIGSGIGLGWSAVVVAVIWAVIAAVLYSVGRRRLAEVEGLPRTTETAKQIPDALAGKEERA